MRCSPQSEKPCPGGPSSQGTRCRTVPPNSGVERFSSAGRCSKRFAVIVPSHPLSEVGLRMSSPCPCHRPGNLSHLSKVALLVNDTCSVIGPCGRRVALETAVLWGLRLKPLLSEPGSGASRRQAWGACCREPTVQTRPWKPTARKPARRGHLAPGGAGGEGHAGPRAELCLRVVLSTGSRTFLSGEKSLTLVF